MYIQLVSVQKLPLGRRVRDFADRRLHLLPNRGSQRFLQALLRRLPMGLRIRDLALSRRRQAKHSLTPVFSGPDLDPALLAQHGQRACERSAVHGKTGAQCLLVGLANDGKSGEQSELGNFDSGFAEFLVVKPSHKSCETAKVLTGARERKERVMNWHIHTMMYIHLFGQYVKVRRTADPDLARADGTAGPAWITDLINGDHAAGNSSSAAAVAGYPNINVTAGYLWGLPVGISFFGRAWSEPTLLKIAYAFEQLTKARQKPRFLATIDIPAS